jgi:integrase
MPVYELKKHDNGVYYVHWTEGRRSKRISTGAKEVDGPKGANTFLGQWLLMDQSVALNGGAGLLLGDLWNVYYTKHIEPNSTAPEAIDNKWRRLKIHFGHLTVAGLTDDVVEDYVDKREEGEIGRPAVPGTVRTELSYIVSMLNWCSHPKRKPPLLKRSDVPLIDLPPASEARDRWLRLPEIQAVLDAAGELRDGERLSKGERFLWLALETCARKTAIQELQWNRVDFETKVIDYNVPGRKRTKKKRAVVPISDALLPVLQRAYEERESDFVIDQTADIWRNVKAIAARAVVEGVSPHVLRHTGATHMARRGIPLWQIAGVLGNSLAMVEKVYAKHCPDGLVNAVNAISNGQLEAAE